MSATSLEKQIIELKDLVNDQKNTISVLQSSLDGMQKALDGALSREEEYAKREKILNAQIEYLTDKLYGTSREKTDTIAGQINLFNEAEVESGLSDDHNEESKSIEIPAHTRKQRATKADKFSNLPVVKRYIDVPEEERVCPNCGASLTYMGEELVRRELEFTPAKAKMVEYYSRTYKCTKCKAGKGIPYIVRGRDGKAHMLHGMASASTVAWVMYQKYCNSVPLYRQEKDWKLYGCDLSRSTLATWIIKNAEDFFRPMCEYFGRHIRGRPYAMADETPLQVLKEEGRDPTSKSYIDKPAIIYRYAPTRSGNVAEEFFRNYSGYLMCDGFSGYNAVKDIKRTGCFAHARRYLLDAVPKKNRLDLSIPAMQGVTYIDKLFDIERRIHMREHSPEEVKELRLRDEKPVLESFWSWLDAQISEKGTKFNKALTYLRNQKPYLERYLEDGNCSFSNNASERCCKDFVVGRKNWLFADSAKGADASAYVYSIVQTAKANGINAYHYLCFLLEKTPTSLSTDEELEALAPWNIDVKEEIKHREELAMMDCESPVHS